MKTLRPLIFAFLFVSCSIAGFAQLNDPASDLYNKGVNAYNVGDYATAIQAFGDVPKNFPASGWVRAARLQLGIANCAAKNYAAAVAQLKPFTEIPKKDGKPAADMGGPIRSNALLFMGIAQMGVAETASDYQKKDLYAQAVTTLTTLLTDFPKDPIVENVLFERANIYAQLGDSTKTIADVKQLLASYRYSAKVPDYKDFLGKVYATDAQTCLKNKDMDGAKAAAQQAFDLWKSIDKAEVAAANTAHFEVVQLKSVLAAQDPKNLDGFKDTLADAKTVIPYLEIIQMQSALVEAARHQANQNLKDQAAAQLAAVEAGRVEQLKASGDFSVNLLLIQAQCFLALSQGDEVRTIIRQLEDAKAITSTMQDQCEQMIATSYAYSGNLQQVEAGLKVWQEKHTGDHTLDFVLVQSATRYKASGAYEDAFQACLESLSESPTGAFSQAAYALGTQVATDNLKQPERVKDLDRKMSGGSGGNDPKFLMISAGNKTARGDVEGAIADYTKVKNNSSAGDLAPQALLQIIGLYQNKPDLTSVVTFCQEYLQKYPTEKGADNVKVILDIAKDSLATNGDDAALDDLQKISTTTTNDKIAAAALFYVIQMDGKREKVEAMNAAADMFRKNLPQRTEYLGPITALVADLLIKKQEFEKAVEIYKSALTMGPKPEDASATQNKIGDAWVSAAQNLPNDQHDLITKDLQSAEDAYLVTLNTYPTQVAAVGDAISGLKQVAQTRVDKGIYKDQTDIEAAMNKWADSLNSPDVKLHMKLAQVANVFTERNGLPNPNDYPAALAKFESIMATSPGNLTRDETICYVSLLNSQKQFDKSIAALNKLKAASAADDVYAQADISFGFASTYIGQSRWVDAKSEFDKMAAMTNDATQWYSQALVIKFDIGLIQEKTGHLDDAFATYSSVMQDLGKNYPLKARAFLGAGRVMEAKGFTTTGDPKTPSVCATRFYKRIDALFSTGTPEESAEGLYLAMGLYLAAGDLVNAQSVFDRLSAYPTTTFYKDGLEKAKGAALRTGPAPATPAASP